MKTNKGYYSIIQYIPDPGRLEAINVGITLVVPDANSTATSVGHEDYSRLLSMFPDADIGRLALALSTLATRIGQTSPTKARIELLVSKLANEVRMTPLRFIKVTERPREALKKLRAELVDV